MLWVGIYTDAENVRSDHTGHIYEQMDLCQSVTVRALVSEKLIQLEMKIGLGMTLPMIYHCILTVHWDAAAGCKAESHMTVLDKAAAGGRWRNKHRAVLDMDCELAALWRVIAAVRGDGHRMALDKNYLVAEDESHAAVLTSGHCSSGFVKGLGGGSVVRTRRLGYIQAREGGELE